MAFGADVAAGCLHRGTTTEASFAVFRMFWTSRRYWSSFAGFSSAAFARDSAASLVRPSFSRTFARFAHARSSVGFASSSRSKCTSSSASRSASEATGAAGAIRCHRVRKSFTTPLGAGAASGAEIPEEPQIAHSDPAEDR